MTTIAISGKNIFSVYFHKILPEVNISRNLVNSMQMNSMKPFSLKDRDFRKNYLNPVAYFIINHKVL
jgi:hypothetical protein